MWRKDFFVFFYGFDPLSVIGRFVLLACIFLVNYSCSLKSEVSVSFGSVRFC